jgi:hypothetical protein
MINSLFSKTVGISLAKAMRSTEKLAKSAKTIAKGARFGSVSYFL